MLSSVSKAESGFMRGWGGVGGDLPQGMMRQKYPGADRVKNDNYNMVK